jgi:hypothetical protein
MIYIPIRAELALSGFGKEVNATSKEELAKLPTNPNRRKRE